MGSKTSVVFLGVDMFEQYWVIVLPLVITGLTQIVKAFVVMGQTGHFKFESLFKWGGFPSSHMALVSSVATVAGLVDGIRSVTFVIALSFAILVMRDAMGLRMFVEHHSRAINVLREQSSAKVQARIPKQRLSIGHTRVEIAGGIIFGVGLTLLAFYAIGF